MDLCSELLVEATKAGTEQHLELALLRFGKDVNKPTATDSFPLHLAVWRNHLPIVDRLLHAGAKPDLSDGESGWTCLHRALYLGNLAAAQKLLLSGAQLDILDHKGRTPLDLVSQELRQAGQRHVAPPPCSPASARDTHGTGATGTSCIAYAWGSGANYQLGTGSTDFHETPVRVDAFGGMQAVALAAAKFHSAALDASGRLYTWGWGRGGRLGHPDPHIHSGERALIHPWAVLGMGRRHVCAVAAGKHHMVVCTSSGELFSWGANRDGRLGYPGPDTQPTPKKIAAMRARVVAVAAANKHSAAITTSGEAWTWGENGHGQLGYGTSDSAANPTPRLVEALRGKTLTQVSCAKRHTVVLTADGEPITWGHRIVTPRRVQLAGARDVSRAACGSSSAGDVLVFHKGHQEMTRPVAVALAAGYMHTSVITAGGAVLTWWSADPSLRVQEVLGELAGKRATSLSAGKMRTAVATEQGEVYMWESKPHTHGGRAGQQQGEVYMWESKPHTHGGRVGQQQGEVYMWESKPHTHGGRVGQQQGEVYMWESKPHTHGGRAGQQQGEVYMWESKPHMHGGRAGQQQAGSTGAQGQGQGQAASLTSPSPALAGGVPSGSLGGGASALPGPGPVASVVPVRVPGLQRVAAVSVGEKHSLALVSWALPPLPDKHGLVRAVHGADAGQGTSGDGARERSHSPSSSLDGWDVRSSGGSGGEGGEGDGGAAGTGHAEEGAGGVVRGGSWAPAAALGLVGAPPAAGPTAPRRSSGSSAPPTASASPAVAAAPWPQSAAFDPPSPGRGGGASSSGPVDSLQVLAQRAVAHQLVEPRTVLQIYEYADLAGAALLRAYCLAYCLQNLDAVLGESRAALESLPLPLVLELEQHYKAWLSPAPPGGGAPDAAAPGRRHESLSTPFPGGQSPPLGSSPPVGFSVPPPGSSPSFGLGSSLPLGSWTDRAGKLGASPPAPGSGPEGMEAARARRRLLLQRLQPGRRPTSAPLWLGGRALMQKVAPGAAMQHAVLAALGAIGHAGGQEREWDSQMHTLALGDAQFASLADREAEAVREQRARLLRNVRKKLQQTEALAARQTEGAVLDSQQIAKLGQRDALEEAVQALEAGASLEVVQHMVAQAQELTTKLSVVQAAGAGTSGAGASAGPSTSLKRAESALPASPRSARKSDAAGKKQAAAGSGGASVAPAGPVDGSHQGAAPSSLASKAQGSTVAAKAEKQQAGAVGAEAGNRVEQPQDAGREWPQQDSERAGRKGRAEGQRRQQQQAPGQQAAAGITAAQAFPPAPSAAAGAPASGSSAGPAPLATPWSLPTPTVAGPAPLPAAGAPHEAFPFLGMPMSLSIASHSMSAATPIAASVGGARHMPMQQTPPPAGSGAARTPGPGSEGAPGLGSKGKEKAARKGGLSMFLSGVLDKPMEKPADKASSSTAAGASQQQPKGPAWGGAVAQQLQAAGPVPLREVMTQDQQRQQKQQQQQQQQQQQALTGKAPAPASGASSDRMPTSAGKAAASTSSTQQPLARPIPGAAPAAPLPGAHKDAAAAAAAGKVSLAEFIQPKAAVAKGAAKAAAGKRRGSHDVVEAGGPTLAPVSGTSPPSTPAPAWGAAGAGQQQRASSGHIPGGSPPSAPTLLSLRDIQAEQEQRRTMRAMPAAAFKPAATPTPAGGAAGSSAGGAAAVRHSRGGPGGPPATPVPTASPAMPARAASSSSQPVYGTSPPSGSSPTISKWYVPETDQPRQQALQAIQTEEVAIQQLTQLYGGKVIVRRAS